MSGDEHYVYHAPVEPSPRALASGDQNVIEAPHSLGALIDNPIVRGILVPRPGLVSVRPVGLPVRAVDGNPAPICPAWGCGAPSGGVLPTYVLRTPSIYPYPGATATVPQPPPSAGGSQIVPLTQPLPLSPAPSPTVAVSSDQTAPQLTQPGTPLDSSGATISTVSGIGGWLAQSTLISGIPNWGIAAAGVFAAMMLFGGNMSRASHGGRR